MPSVPPGLEQKCRSTQLANVLSEQYNNFNTFKRNVVSSGQSDAEREHPAGAGPAEPGVQLGRDALLRPAHHHEPQAQQLQEVPQDLGGGGRDFEQNGFERSAKTKNLLPCLSQKFVTLETNFKIPLKIFLKQFLYYTSIVLRQQK